MLNKEGGFGEKTRLQDLCFSLDFCIFAKFEINRPVEGATPHAKLEAAFCR